MYIYYTSINKTKTHSYGGQTVKILFFSLKDIEICIVNGVFFFPIFASFGVLKMDKTSAIHYHSLLNVKIGQKMGNLRQRVQKLRRWPYSQRTQKSEKRKEEFQYKFQYLSNIPT